MAIIVEDGTGLVDAQSYVSVSDADAYHAARGNTAWVDGGADVKEAALVRATDYIDGDNGPRWPGIRATAAQALDWPRLEAYDRDGYLQEGLPEAVIRATCEAAFVEFQSAGALTEELERGGAVIREKVGPIETEYSPNAPAATVYPAIRKALSRLLRSGGLKVQRV